MKEVTIELSTVFIYIILFYIIYNIITIIGDKADKHKFKNKKSYLNPFRSFNNDFGIYFMIFCISSIALLLITVLYNNVIKNYTFNIIW
jgi:hypothetical protein